MNDNNNEQELLPEKERITNAENIANELYSSKERISIRPSNAYPPSNRFTTVDNNFFNADLSNFRDGTSITSKNEQSRNQSNDMNSNTTKKNSKPKNEINSPDKIVYNMKIILLGESSVGKTSILSRYINNQFEEAHKCTVALENKSHTVQVTQNTYAKLSIWDTAGQEKFRTLTRQYYTDAQGVILVFDLSNQESFNKLDSWINELNNNASPNIAISIIGNKSDLMRGVHEDDINKFIDNGKYLYQEVSAKTGNNISIAFEELIEEIINKIKIRERAGNGEGIGVNRESKSLEDIRRSLSSSHHSKKKKCC